MILVTIDTLRADHVGLSGLAPHPTPAMDRIGREGAWAPLAVAPFGRTTQSVGTILTGLHPLRHGADGLGMVLPAEVTTLAEAFAAAGYRTGAFVSNVNLRAGLGFEQGHEVFSNSAARWKGNSAPALTGEALAWIDSLSGAEPFFLWLHYLDPHWPYTPSDETLREVDPQWKGAFDLFRRVEGPELTKGQVIFFADRVLTPREVEHARRTYQAEVLDTDRALGIFLEGLERRGLLDRSILMLAADHGEAMGDHRYWFAHGEYLYDDTLRVPWALRAPGLVPAGTRIDGLVLLEDIAPTLTHLAQIDFPTGTDGTDLVPLLSAGGTVRLAPRPQVHLTDHHLVHPENPRRPVPGRPGRWWALRDGPWKLIEIPQPEGRRVFELYNLERDPAESEDLSAEQTERVAAMSRQLDQWRRRVGRGPDGDAAPGSARELDALKGLGYM
ncbi:MAG: sulfatase-like hydrolase/transferase [Acidobacteriota bacterium]|nr:sulfatase-like hydrolase/transferase [Acidobacteriota bacterium]